MITGFVRGQALKVPAVYVAADTINYLTAQFVFQTSEWNGLEVWSHWEKSGVAYDIRLDDGRITEEMHLNLSAGAWRVYLHGNRYADGEVVQRITTGVATLEVQPTGTLDGEPFPEIPASVTEQILARLEEIEQNGGSGGGSGTVKSVARVAPDESGDVPLTPADIGAAEVEITDEEVNVVTVSGTASVGQTIVVEKLDDQGRPVMWRSADFPSGGSSVEVDTTLSQSGKAADAKAVGDALNKQSEAIGNQKTALDSITLSKHTDGLVYIFINGLPVGGGIKINADGGLSDEVITLSDGIRLTKVMFSDDFDGESLGSTWKATYGRDNPALENWWTAKEKNLGVADSCVRLTMLRDNPTSEWEISAAKIETMQYNTPDNYGFDTGYCEVRFKLDYVGEGVWPAIWCVGQTQTDEYTNITDSSVTRTIHGRPWPWAGEIDHFDAMMSSFTPGLIYQTDPYTSSILTTKGSESKTIEADTWYLIGLYKSKDEIKVYFNRTLIATFDIAGNECFSGMGEKLIINLSTGTVGGTLPDEIDEVNMYVDYVKVYSLTNDYVELSEQNTATLLPEYADGFTCVADRQFLLFPQFAENTKNTALYWYSSDTSVATVENGFVKTLVNGNTTIFAKDIEGNEVINFSLAVADNAGVLADKLSVTSEISAIANGDSATVTAKIYPTNCDEVTPTLSIVSGAEYCTIAGLTINNVNASGADQTVTVRVNTNNPEIYEDITFVAKASINYDITPSENLLCNYNVSGITAYNTDGTGFKWVDSKGNGNMLFSRNNTTFDGQRIVATNALWGVNNSYANTLITNNVPDTFTALAMVSVTSGNAIGLIFNGDKTNQYSSSAENAMLSYGNRIAVYQNTSAAKKVDLPESVFEQNIIVGEIYNENNEVIAVLITEDGEIYKTDAVSSLYSAEDPMECIRVFGFTAQCFVGSAYQALLFNAVLDDNTIKDVAAQMYRMNA